LVASGGIRRHQAASRGLVHQATARVAGAASGLLARKGFTS
jgi:hypothetical protein